MKCLSLMQPWASLVANGSKKIETRSWKTNYRGELYIHASQRTYKKILLESPFVTALKNEQLPNSVIIAKCKLVDCVKMDEAFIEEVKKKDFEYDFGEYKVGRYAWFLEDVEILKEPITAKGKLGIWKYEKISN